MDRGAWQASVHGIARVGHDLVTKPPTCIKVNINASSAMDLHVFPHPPTTNVWQKPLQYCK